MLSDTWVAEDGSTTNFPFGVHQIHEEIVAPMVQNLMNETRIERMKIYNHIKDQKISYLNKWHQDTEDFYGRNRAESADLINLMRASLRDYVAAYNTMASLKKTEDSMQQSGGSLESTVVSANDNSAEVFAAFELQSKEFQNVQLDFENYMERLKEDIDLKAEKFEHIEYYDALLRDGNSKDIAVAANDVHNLDERRKPLITVNPLFAKVSEMPPVPSMEELTNDHFSLNLPAIAKNALRELDQDLLSPQPSAEPVNTVAATPETTIETTGSQELFNEPSPDQFAPEEHEETEAHVTTEDEESIDETDEVEVEVEDEVEKQTYTRAEVINALIESSDYSEEELNGMSDDELKEILGEDIEIS